MANDVPALTLRRLNTFYADSHVLHDLSLTLQQGRVLALLGRNGVGKTTCLHSIVGFVPPRSGDIDLFGEPLARLAPERIAAKGVGLVPQGRRVFASLTVRENLLVAARRGGVWSEARVFSTFPRLAERCATRAGSLSGGEQQMLAIGRALMGGPRVLLLDEPSEGLAPRIVNELQAVIRSLKDEGLSILLVEQNAKLALELADDAVVLDTARVSFDGSADALRSRGELLNELLGLR